MFHMTFSPSHNRGKGVQLVYKPQRSCKFTYNQLYSFKPIATHSSFLNYLKYFQEVYELAVWIKMFHMTFSPSHNRGKGVQLVYKPQRSCKLTYNQLYSFKPIATHSSLINYLIYFQEEPFGSKCSTCLSLHPTTVGKVYSQCTSHSGAANLPIISYTALSLQPPTHLS